MELLYIALLNLTLATLVLSKPISVTFGTKQGPIVPPPITTTTIPPPNQRREPAPVRELIDDIPNPSTYRPYLPNQYRKALLSFRPNPNLIVGTVQDQKYYSSSNKYNEFKRAEARAIGLDYRGPQYFELQPYEIDKINRDALFNPVMQPYNQQWNYQNKQVPEIGIVYSSGVRYYVPQIDYSRDQHLNENSVYDRSDSKYYNYNVQQN